MNGVKGTTIASGAITEVSGTPTFAGYLLASVTPPFLNMWHKGNGVVQLDFLTLDDSVAMSIE